MKRRPGPFKEEVESLQPFSIEISKHLIGPIQAVQNLYHQQMYASVHPYTGVAGLKMAFGGGVLVKLCSADIKGAFKVESTPVGFDGQAVAAGARPLFRDGSR